MKLSNPQESSLPVAAGTYALGLRLQAPRQITVGALGIQTFAAGTYVYVGSAWGPGGLQARVGRHLRGSTKLRWHIDYLRAHAPPLALWLAPGVHLECVWARWLAACPEVQVTVPHFGASDCACKAHLFYLENYAPSTLALPGNPQFIDLDPSRCERYSV